MPPEPTILRSPALVTGEVAVEDKVPSRRKKKRFHSRPIKDFVTRKLYAALQVLPRPVLVGIVKGACAVLKILSTSPGSSLRASCVALARIGDRRGYRLAPGQVAREFIDSVQAVLLNGMELHHGGAAAVLPRARLDPPDSALLQGLLERYGGVVGAVTHNPGSIFSSIRVSHELPTLLISRNSSSVRRTRIALDFYEKMEVRVLMVRGGNPMQLTRACLRALKSKTVVVATLDAVYRQPNKVMLPVFGEPVGLAPWASRIAVQAKVPIVPTYVVTEGRTARVRLGEPLVPTSTEEGMRHYMAFFERMILEHPASWSFLADKRWRKVLIAAAAGTRSEDEDEA